MQRPKRALAMLLALVLVPLAVVVGQSQPAQADPVPPTVWPPAAVGELGWVDSTTHLDGSVTLGCTDYRQDVKLRTYSPTGVMSQVTSREEFLGCHGKSVVDYNGVVYTEALASSSTPNENHIRAFKSGKLLWTYPLPCFGLVSGMALGVNQNLYVRIEPVGSGGNRCSDGRILGLKTTLNPGQTMPEQVLNVRIVGSHYHGGLAAFKDGLAVRYDGVKYIGYDGHVISEHPSEGSALYGESGFGVRVSDGRAFVPIRKQGYSECNGDDYNVSSSIRRITPFGENLDIGLPSCSRVLDLSPTPDGGVVVRVSSRGVLGWEEWLLKFLGSGILQWKYELPPSKYGDQWSHFTVDIRGNVAVQKLVVVRKLLEGTERMFPEVHLVLLGATSGKPLQGASLVLRGDYSGKGSAYLGISSLRVNVANGVVFVLATYCEDMKWGVREACRQETTKLYPFRAPAVTGDYPRMAILNYGKPWRNYAALGDSFSSGEGAGSYLEGTDTNANTCHRSSKAYAKKLHGDPAKRLKLAKFVACSGATTYNVVTAGQHNEPAQITALGSSTQVVTLSIGGNDAHFAKFVAKCLFTDCATPENRQRFLDGIAAAQPKILDALVKIKNKAPNAKVYILGYPHLLPSGIDCGKTSGDQYLLEGLLKLTQKLRESGGGDFVRTFLMALGLGYEEAEAVVQNNGEVVFSPAEQQFAKEFVAALNTAVRTAAGNAGTSRVRYVSATATGSPFKGYELCTAKPYFNGLDLINPEHSFHPNSRGAEAYRQLLVANIA